MKYYHRIPSARFIMPDGKDICFAGGEFDSDTLTDPEVKANVEKELHKVANVPSSMIYTLDAPIIGVGEEEVKREIEATATAAFDAQNNVPAGAKTQPLPMAAPQVASIHTAAQVQKAPATIKSAAPSSLAAATAAAKAAVEAAKKPATTVSAK